MKFLHVLTGAVVLLSSIAPMLPAAAQVDSTPTTPRQERLNRRGPQLNLTEAQKTEMKKIREATHAKVLAVLTPEQKAQLETLRQSAPRSGRQPGQKPQGQPGQLARGFQSLNLTEDQKAQIKAIREAGRQQVQAILTPEQRAQMEQMRQTGQQRRQMRQPGF